MIVVIGGRSKIGKAPIEELVRSIFGSDPSSEATFVPDHLLCDEYLRDSDVQHVIVQPNLFLAERR